MFRYLIPLFLNLALVPIWFSDERMWAVSILHGLINVFIVPIYLLTVLFPTFNNKLTSFLKGACINFCVSLCGTLISYIAWGVCTGYLYEPDSETIYILKVEMQLSMILFVVGSIVISVIKRGNNRR